MPKEIKIEPRFHEEDGLETFILPKGYVYLRLERRKTEGTLRIIAKKMVAKKKPVKK